ncbi:GlcG/HbpS family heme-binding protein [Morganella morganii]|uniref:GlcG/HbpS family heme-binding protein n=1 Tax=Morganella morganii TaxID=582 RepID=UPI003EBEB6FF
MKKIIFYIMLSFPGIGVASNFIEKRADITLELATKLATETLNTCHSINKYGVVSVVDRGGNLVTVMRDNNVGPHNTIASQRKAYTALSTKIETSRLMNNAQMDSKSSNLNTIKELLLLGGGVPIRFDNEVIGAIGVAGMGGSILDEQCATQAINKIMK